jgi:hypothetical protein
MTSLKKQVFEFAPPIFVCERMLPNYAVRKARCAGCVLANSTGGPAAARKALRAAFSARLKSCPDTKPNLVCPDTIPNFYSAPGERRKI